MKYLYTKASKCGHFQKITFPPFKNFLKTDLIVKAILRPVNETTECLLKNEFRESGDNSRDFLLQEIDDSFA
jgi:hypothetical protein